MTEAKIIARLATAVAVLAGTAAVIQNTQTIGKATRDACRFARICKPAPAPAPVLPGYDSPEMGGGSDQGTQCVPLLDKYRAENPGFNVELKSWEDKDKDTWGHVTYHYHCRYSATPKA